MARRPELSSLKVPPALCPFIYRVQHDLWLTILPTPRMLPPHLPAPCPGRLTIQARTSTSPSHSTFRLVMSDPIETLLDHLTGHWGGQTIYAGVKLGVIETLADQSRSAKAVAETLDLDPENTYRLLRALGSLGVVEERPDGIFELSEMGEMLTQDHPQSLRSFFLLEEEFEFPAWTHLPELIRSGKKSGFKEEYGHSPYEHVNVDPVYAEVFDQAMTTASKLETAAVLEVLGSDAFAGISHLCDV